MRLLLRELAPIATSVSGIHFSERFPKLAGSTGQFRVMRTLSHSDTVHTTAGYALFTGVTHPRANQVASATMIKRTPDDRPQLGSVAYKTRLERESGLMPPIAIPEITCSRHFWPAREFPAVRSSAPRTLRERIPPSSP